MNFLWTKEVTIKMYAGEEITQCKSVIVKE